MNNQHKEKCMLQNRLDALVLENQMQEMYSGAILGFSGGADSSALLHLLKDKVQSLVCVHINHMIRGDEADRDENFAIEICQKYGVKLLTYKVDVPTLSKERKKGLEETAREVRYEIFNSLLEKNPEYKCIVTAHNLDDSLETVIFNFARGTGPKGLVGIEPRQGKLFRPLVTTSKKEILEYCEKNDIPYVTDSTNKDTAYTRNHIRHNIIPNLEKINPDVLGASRRLSNILASDEEYFNKLTDKVIEENKIENKIELSLLNSLERAVASRLLIKVLGETIDYYSVVSCIELARKGTVGSLLNLPNGISFKIERGYAHFVKTNDLKEKSYRVRLENGLNIIQEIDTIIALNDTTVPQGYVLTSEISLDGQKITSPLYARQKIDGDTIRSGKMTKKLKKLFVDGHIPSHLRTKIPVITMEEKIIAVPGVAVRDSFGGKDIKILIYIKR
jgi:tRNA(Ile)-lysidine synthase